jgi:hypothetical protein
MRSGIWFEMTNSGPFFMRGPSGRYVHPMRNSTSLYDIRDVPAAARAKVGKAKWKISLKTCELDEGAQVGAPLR